MIGPDISSDPLCWQVGHPLKNVKDVDAELRHEEHPTTDADAERVHERQW